MALGSNIICFRPFRLAVPHWFGHDLRFHTPLIELDRQISRIQLSDKTSRFRVQRHLQLLNIYWS